MSRFCGKKPTHFNRGNTARNIENNKEKLKQLVLIEEFKN